MKLFITGGCGFVGSHLLDYLLHHTAHSVVNLDNLSSSESLRWAKASAKFPQYQFIQGDALDESNLQSLLRDTQPDAVINLVAHTDVAAAIQHPQQSLQTNLGVTECLLRATLEYWRTRSGAAKLRFRYLQVSTDAVYGDRSTTGTAAHEATAYRPTTPLAASKAAADHWVDAWGHTYGLPTLIAYATNSYGAHQPMQKFIPHVLQQALAGQVLPLYGDGEHIRDWLHVEDLVRGLHLVLTLGRPGHHYHISAEHRLTNAELLDQICDHLKALAPEFLPKLGIDDFHDLITHVDDPAGNDRYHGLDARKLRDELGWQDRIPFNEGLRAVIDTYLHAEEPR